MIPVISLVAQKSGIGKTTLLEKVIGELKRRGWKVAIVKHHHRDFDIDLPGKDSWRHTQAGADSVVIVSPRKLAMICQLEEEPDLDQIVAQLTGVDIVITEGYKRGNKPKIEVLRAAVSEELFCSPEELIAVVSDVKLDLAPHIPCFDLDDFRGIVELLEKNYLAHK